MSTHQLLDRCSPTSCQALRLSFSVVYVFDVWCQGRVRLAGGDLRTQEAGEELRTQEAGGELRTQEAGAADVVEK